MTHCTQSVWPLSPTRTSTSSLWSTVRRPCCLSVTCQPTILSSCQYNPSVYPSAPLQPVSAAAVRGVQPLSSIRTHQSNISIPRHQVLYTNGTITSQRPHTCRCHRNLQSVTELRTSCELEEAPPDHRGQQPIELILLAEEER